MKEPFLIEHIPQKKWKKFRSIFHFSHVISQYAENYPLIATVRHIYNMEINQSVIREKFGDDYMADERTFTMGIDQRFTKHFAERFIGLNVLETCTGAGFTTLSLARAAMHIFTVEIDEAIQKKAIINIEKAGLSSKVTFIFGSILARIFHESSDSSH